MELDTALASHLAWQARLRAAVGAREVLDAAAIGADYFCEFGIWLHGEGRSRFGRLTSFHTCVERHALFHLEAAEIAHAINFREFDRALKLLNAGMGYGRASDAVKEAIQALQREVNLASYSPLTARACDSHGDGEGP